MNWYFFLWLHILFESFFPIFSYFAMQEVQLLWVIAISTIISFLCGVFVLVKYKLYNQYKNRKIVTNMLLSSLFLWTGGILYFFWIKYSSPSIAATLLLLQSFFAFIIFNLLWWDKYYKKQVIWAILAFVWGVLVVYDGSWNFFNLWAIIMLVSCMSMTIWNFYTKRASSKWASPFFLLVNRNFLMVIATTILAFYFVWKPDIVVIQDNFIWIFLIWFLVLFLSKLSWIEALNRLNPFVAISFFPLVPLLVLVLSYFILDELPDIQKLLWFIPIIIGAMLLVKKN